MQQSVLADENANANKSNPDIAVDPETGEIFIKNNRFIQTDVEEWKIGEEEDKVHVNARRSKNIGRSDFYNN